MLQVGAITGSKILRIMKGLGLAPEIPEDLYHLIKKAVSMRKHLELNRKDKDGKFRLILVESRIHRLARYYKVRSAACKMSCALQCVICQRRAASAIPAACPAHFGVAHSSMCLRGLHASSSCTFASSAAAPAWLSATTAGTLASHAMALVTLPSETGLAVLQKSKKLPPNWRYESATASALVA